MSLSDQKCAMERRNASAGLYLQQTMRQRTCQCFFNLNSWIFCVDRFTMISDEPFCIFMYEMYYCFGSMFKNTGFWACTWLISLVASFPSAFSTQAAQQLQAANSPAGKQTEGKSTFSKDGLCKNISQSSSLKNVQANLL